MLSEKLAHDITQVAMNKLQTKTAAVKEAVSVDYIVRALRQSLANGDGSSAVRKYKKLMERAVKETPANADRVHDIANAVAASSGKRVGVFEDGGAGHALRTRNMLNGDASKHFQGWSDVNFGVNELAALRRNNPRDVGRTWYGRQKKFQPDIDHNNTVDTLLAPSKDKPNWIEGIMPVADINRKRTELMLESADIMSGMKGIQNRLDSPDFENSIMNAVKARSKGRQAASRQLAYK